VFSFPVYLKVCDLYMTKMETS